MSLKKLEVTAGVDPEWFFESQGAVVPAFQVLKSKKEVQARGAQWGTYWDGFQAECFVPPSVKHGELLANLRLALRDGVVEVRTQVPTARIAQRTVIDVPEDTLATASEEHVALGCSPSLNAYEMEGMKVEEPRGLKFRFSGGHYHMGVPLMNPGMARRMILASDVVAGVPSLLMFQNHDNPVRRMYYGLPGEYRLPAWGVEYRFLSNAWLFHPAVAKLTWHLVRAGLKLGAKDVGGVFQFDQEGVKKCLLDGDLDAAEKHVKENKNVYTAILRAEYGDQAGRVAELISKPIREFVPLDSVEENWCLFKDQPRELGVLAA